MDINPLFRADLNHLRETFGGPLEIFSGARCPKRNRIVGGASRSLHLEGLAADIAWPKLHSDRLWLIHFASQQFTGLGFYPGFLHVDRRDRDGRDPSVWVQE